MYGIVYETINLISGKKYIGQHRCRSDKFDSYLGSGLILKKAIIKYGEKNFIRKTLCVCETQDELNQMEQYYIKMVNAVHNDMYYNISEGGMDYEDSKGYHADFSIIKKKLKAWDREVLEYENRKLVETVKAVVEQTLPIVDRHVEKPAKAKHKAVRRKNNICKTISDVFGICIAKRKRAS